MSDKGKWYEFTGESILAFTKNKLYQCINEDFTKCSSFIDNKGIKNGWGSCNTKYFKEVISQEFNTNKEPNYEIY